MQLDLYLLPIAYLTPLTILLARTSGFFLTTPFFSSQVIPLRVRMGLAFAVVLILLPTQQESPLPSNVAALSLLVAREFAIGAFLGWMVRLFFAALQLAGQLSGFAVGLSLARVIDPAAAVQDALGPTLYQFIGLILFVSVGGHRELLLLLIESYQSLPIGMGAVSSSILTTVSQVCSAMFSMAVRLAAPVSVLLFLIDLILALANRVAPQIPILMIGMPAKTWIGLAALGWGIAAFATPAIAWLSRAPQTVTRVVQLLAAGATP